MKNTDSMISEADIQQAKDDIATREWHKAIEGLMERESDLFIDISLQLQRITELVEATGAPPQHMERLIQRVHIVLWTSLIVLDRCHRRLWNEFLPDDGKEPRKPKGKRK
jgi:hypothetical protein